MLRKKKPAKPEKHDFTALDAAVSELSKQTSALLGSDQEDKKAKPTLPKKNAPLKSRAKSFDIIHSPNHSKPANLKTAVVNRPKLEEPEAELLPEHASLSFNEQGVSEVPPVQVEAESKDTRPDDTSSVITTHKASMITAPDSPDEAVETLTKAEEPESKPEAPKPTEPEVSQEPEQPAQTSGAIKFESDQKTDEKPTESEPEVPAEASSEAKQEPKEEPKPAEAPSEVKEESKEDAKPEDTPEAVPSYESAGVYANNLIKNKDPKGYEPRDSQQLPTVFDTNEYHEELHDWSKLSNGSGSKLILLLLLVVVAGAIAYFVLSGQQLPF